MVLNSFFQYYVIIKAFTPFCYPVLTCILCHQRYPTRHYGFCLPCRLCRHNPLTHNDMHYLLKFGVRAFMWMKKLCKCRSHICICNYVHNLWMIGWMRLFFFVLFFLRYNFLFFHTSSPLVLSPMYYTRHPLPIFLLALLSLLSFPNGQTLNFFQPQCTDGYTVPFWSGSLILIPSLNVFDVNNSISSVTLIYRMTVIIFFIFLLVIRKIN